MCPKARIHPAYIDVSASSPDCCKESHISAFSQMPCHIRRRISHARHYACGTPQMHTFAAYTLAELALFPYAPVSISSGAKQIHCTSSAPQLITQGGIKSLFDVFAMRPAKLKPMRPPNGTANANAAVHTLSTDLKSEPTRSGHREKRICTKQHKDTNATPSCNSERTAVKSNTGALET
jgi:hypothetical protein